ncbi:SdpI family protein [Cellulosimicrobium sp. CUA-896]|uniref:SdpI family protein n=1 Tax=Cellulosimicrobium sp. CUA-896 TaxID=1517881 RepID=UPI000959E48B|nr:SdpI family protein [Cellulosimicrobium sp. CUA-896]OLT54478.1 hypothetical protein BJF88_09115 [Cellulosimicrobium sp. CUA-896]
MLADLVLLPVLLAAGLVLVWCARAAADGRLGRNQVAGIRTAATLASDEAWRAAHRRARPLSEGAGWVLAAAGPVLLLVPGDSLSAVVAGAAALIALGLTVAGAVVGSRAARATAPRG